MNNSNLEKIIADLSSGYGCFKIILNETGNPEDLIVTDINKAFEKITGLAKENILNKKISEIIPWLESDSPDIMQVFGRAAIAGENADFEHFIKRHSRWYRIQVIPQEKYYFSVIFDDITDLKKNERELTERTSLLDQRVKEMNLLMQFSKLMQRPGLTPEIFFRETVNLIPHAFRYPRETAARVIFRDMEISTFDSCSVSSWILSEDLIIRGKRAGAVEVCYKDEKQDMDEGPFLNEELGLIHTLARYMEKIVEKLEADENELRIRQKFQQYLKNAPDGIFINDSNGRYIEVNPAGCKLLGYTIEEMLNLSIQDILPPEEKERGLGEFRKLMKEGRHRTEITLLKKDGSCVPVYLDAVSLPDGTFMAFCKDITESKKAEKELTELASFHKTLLETIPAPIFYKDTNDRYLGANRYFSDYMGLSEKDLIGKSVSDINAVDKIKAIKKLDEELYKSNGNQVYETQVKDFKGNLHDVVFHKAVFKDSNDKPGGIIGVITDITEIKKVQNDLKLYYKVLQSIDQPIILTNHAGDIIEVNDAFLKIYGYSKESVIGQNPNILNPGRKVYKNFGYSDDDYERLFSDLWKTIKNPGPGTWEGIVINKKKDGSLIWIKLIINSVYGQDGDSPHFVGLPIDISGSIQQENMTRVQLYQAIASLSELRDNETGNHMRRVGLFTKLLARANGSSKKYCDDIEIFSQLHDIGKVGILDSLLLADRELTDGEMKIMQTHTVLGHNIVKGVKEMDMAAAITLSHHERWDGTGYPYSLKGDKIPLSARITAIADVYDSLRSERSYKLEWPHDEARDYILQNAGLMFDPALVNHFSRLDKIFEAIYNDLRN